MHKSVITVRMAVSLGEGKKTDRFEAFILSGYSNDKGIWFQLSEGAPAGFIPYGNLLGIFPLTEKQNG